MYWSNRNRGNKGNKNYRRNYKGKWNKGYKKKQDSPFKEELKSIIDEFGHLISTQKRNLGDNVSIIFPDVNNAQKVLVQMGYYTWAIDRENIPELINRITNITGKNINTEGIEEWIEHMSKQQSNDDDNLLF